MPASGGGAVHALIRAGRTWAVRALLLVLSPATLYAATAAETDRIDLRDLLMLGVVVGVIAFACVVAFYFQRAATAAGAARDKFARDIERLKREHDRLQDALTAEPQALIAWPVTGEPEILASTLPKSLELPRDVRALLRFDVWLSAEDARSLDAALGLLRRNGTPFDLMLPTRRGDRILAEGRAVGISAILRIRIASPDYMRLAEEAGDMRTNAAKLEALSALLGVLPIPVWRKDETGRIAWANASYARAAGAVAPDEVVRRQTALLAGDPRLDAPPVAGRNIALRVAAAPGATLKGQFDVLAVAAPGGSIAVARPAELAEIPSEALAAGAACTHVLDRIPTAVALFDTNRRLTYFNQAYAGIWRLDAAWLSTKPSFGEILDRLRQGRALPEQADYRSWRRRQLDADIDASGYQEWWHLPDGRTLNVQADRTPDGGVSYLYEDVSDRIALESRLNGLIHVQRETLDRLSEGVAVFGKDGRLKLFNPAFAAIWRLNVRSLDDEPHIDEIIRCYRVLHDDAEAWETVRLAVTSIGQERRAVESQFDRADGSVIASTCLPLPDGDTLLTYFDVTDTKRVERALIERNEALVAADRMKTQFISHISYELRTPLTNIIGFSELLSDAQTGTLNDRQRDYLSAVRVSGATLLAIINDILDLASIDAGALELKLATVKPDEIVNAAAQGVKERAAAARVTIEVEIDPKLKSFVADGRRVTQILYNLLANAVGFSEAEDVVTVSVTREGDMVTFLVEDRGCGMPAAFVDAAFGRFESRSHGSAHRGAGLGLAIVRSLVELHGGEVSLDSTVGEGTRARFRIPAAGTRMARKPGDPGPPPAALAG